MFLYMQPQRNIQEQICRNNDNFFGFTKEKFEAKKYIPSEYQIHYFLLSGLTNK